jgi:hypothetical protein
MSNKALIAIIVMLVCSLAVNICFLKNIIIKKAEGIINYFKMDKQEKLACKAIGLAYSLNDRYLKELGDYYLALLSDREARR